MPNLTDLISRQALVRGDASAVVFGARSVSFAEFDELVWRASAALARRGFCRGLVAGITFGDEFAHLVASCALARIGATQVSVPASEPPRVRSAIAAQTGIRVLLTDLEGVDDAGVSRQLFDAQAIFAPGAPVERTVRDPRPPGPWLIMVGSGTTGRAKRMPLGHAAWLARFEAQREMLQLVPGETVVCMGSLDFATTRHRYLETLASGGTIVLFDREREGLLGVCRRHAVRVLFASSMHLQQLTDWLPSHAHRVLSGLRALRVGNSTVGDALRQRAIESLTANLYVAYSTNEFGPATVATPAEVASTPGTVGRPAQRTVVRILDEFDRPCPPGRVGAIALRGPGCIDAYPGDPEATARAFRDGWFLPGDAGELAPDGQLIHRGRTDDMMILDGINIFPAEIENVMTAHPAVAQAVAFALPSRQHDQWPVCAVTLAHASTADSDELLAFAAERLGSRAPRRIFIVHEIPRTANGKPLRRELAARFARRPDAT